MWLAIDVGILHMGWMAATPPTAAGAPWTLHGLDLVNIMVMAHRRVPEATCPLFHSAHLVDRVGHFLQDMAPWIQQAETILVEKQPPQGHTAVEQLLMAGLPRAKLRWLYPQHVQLRLGCQYLDYEERKVFVEAFWENSVTARHLRRPTATVDERALWDAYHALERRHDVADAYALLWSFWIDEDQRSRQAAAAATKALRKLLPPVTKVPRKQLPAITETPTLGPTAALGPRTTRFPAKDRDTMDGESWSTWLEQYAYIPTTTATAAAAAAKAKASPPGLAPRAPILKPRGPDVADDTTMPNVTLPEGATTANDAPMNPSTTQTQNTEQNMSNQAPDPQVPTGTTGTNNNNVQTLTWDAYTQWWTGTGTGATTSLELVVFGSETCRPCTALKQALNALDFSSEVPVGLQGHLWTLDMKARPVDDPDNRPGDPANDITKWPTTVLLSRSPDGRVTGHQSWVRGQLADVWPDIVRQARAVQYDLSADALDEAFDEGRL